MKIIYFIMQSHQKRRAREAEADTCGHRNKAAGANRERTDHKYLRETRARPATNKPDTPIPTRRRCADPCYADRAECAVAHPAAVCALPACDPDDDHALLALPNVGRFLGLFSFRFCVGCASLAAHGLCAELRPGLPALDSVGGCSCAPPRTVGERECTSAALETTAWPQHGRQDTPALEHPSVRDVCVAGLDTAVVRSARWLDFAKSYQLQTADGNAGVIAQHLCLERRFESLVCLSGSATASCTDTAGWVSTLGESCDQYVSATATARARVHCIQDTGSDGRTAAAACPVSCDTCSSQSSPFADIHDQACQMAENIGRGHSIDNLLTTTDVPPLSLTVYHTTYQSINSFIQAEQQTYDSLETDRQLHATISRQVGVSGADASDGQQLFQDKVDEAAGRRQQYSIQIKEIDGTIVELYSRGLWWTARRC